MGVFRVNNVSSTQIGMPLSMASVGSRVRIMKIVAGRELNQRLAEMGMVTGAEVEVLDGRMMGPLVVKLGGSRLVLGQGMAMKILVSEI